VSVAVTGSDNDIARDVPVPVSDIDASEARPRPDLIRAVPVRHYGQWVSAAILFIFAAAFVREVLKSPNMRWDVVGEWFLAPDILRALAMTIELTILCMVLGIVLGVVVAVMRQSGNPVLSGTATAYVAVFRGIPALVQLVLWFNIGFLFPRLAIGIPFGPEIASAPANSVITGFTAALLGLGLNESAYMSEIVRAGILSVGSGQIDAGRAFGMTRLQIMRRIVLPQAIPIILPPTGNQTIGMMKNTSLASVVGTAELLQMSQIIFSANYQVIPLLIVASMWYLILTALLTAGLVIVERRFGASTSRTSGGRGNWLGRRLATLRERRPATRSAGDSR
jgi:polar amino acid transport system permease protein